MSKRNGKESQQKIEAVDKEKASLDLRRAGFTYREIADTLTISVGAAHAYVKTGMMRAIEECKESGSLVRAQELDRIDRMQRAVWKQAIEGDMQAIATVLRLMERRAALLNIDAPKSFHIEEGNGKSKKGLSAIYADLKESLVGKPSEEQAK